MSGSRPNARSIYGGANARYRRKRAVERQSDCLLMKWRAFDCDAVQKAAFTLIIVDRKMPCGTVVPQRQGAYAPVEPTGELGAHRMPVQIVEQCVRLVVAPSLEAQRKAGIDIERLAAGFRVADHHGMDGVLR